MDQVDSRCLSARLIAAHAGMVAGLVASLTLTAGLVGCSSSGKPTAVAIQPSQMVRETAAEGNTPDAQDAVKRQAGALRVSGDRSGPIAESDNILDVSAEAGRPEVDPTAITAASLAKGPAFIDAKIGDINNKAIYASSFLEPMAERLRAAAVKAKPAEWRKFASDLIRDELIRMKEDELLRAEALSSLKPEQRQGLTAMMENYAEEQRLKSGGSSEAARRRLFDEKGQTVEEFIKERETFELVGYQLQRTVMKNIQISRKDLELLYEKYYDFYNPTPTVYLRLILLEASRTDAIDSIAQQLHSGKTFEEVAKSKDNEYSPSTGGTRKIELKDEFMDTKIFAMPELNNAVHELSPGQWVGPIAYSELDETRAGRVIPGRKMVGFIAFERIDQIKTNFYDAQMTMEAELREFEIRKARAKYIERLDRRASHTPIPEMLERLLAIATERYGPGAPRR